MGFTPGVGRVSDLNDTFLSNPADSEVLTYNAGKWKNLAPSGGSPTLANLPAGSTITVQKSASWPARPTSRADITVMWKGPDPSPAIVSSGTGGMLDNVDIRLVTP